MPALSPGSVDAPRTLGSISFGLAACLLALTAACSTPSSGVVTVRHIGDLHGVIAPRIAGRLHLVAFSRQHDSPIVLQGKSLATLGDSEKHELEATYDAGYSIVLLDATMHDIKVLHRVVGKGVSYRSKDAGVVLAYALRRENQVPTATMLTRVDRTSLRTPTGEPDATGLADEQTALGVAAERTIDELRRLPQVGMMGPARDASGQVDWLSWPIQTTTFAISSPEGVYNTPINVYALYRCLDGTDHYAVTAGADWTATNAKWQGATSAGPNPTMYQGNNGQLVIDWQDGRTYCSSGGFDSNWDNVCRYVNYPLSYELTMVPRNEGVTQLNAAPSATQGQATSYTSGFSFSIGGTVNVSATGPGGGIAAGAVWTNTTQTTVPPLIVEVGNTVNQGVDWNFKYCTTGLEPDPGTNCTDHVQMVKDVCQAQLGDDSRTNPQQGQTPVGKFSNASEGAHWQTSTRVGSTFDIEVGFKAQTANTIAHLGNSDFPGPDPDASCNHYGCACVSVTKPDPVSKSVTFEIPFPSTTCR